MNIRIAGALLVGTLMLTSALPGAQPVPVRTAREIEERFLAPCCWSESVAVHNSPAAREMRTEIEKLVTAGKGEQEIVDYYVGRHGARILREPLGIRRVWLTAGPIAAAALGCWLVIAYLRRLRRAAAPTAAVAGITASLNDEDLEW